MVLPWIFFAPTIENGEELCIQLFFFGYFFQAKSATTKNDLTRLSDISYKNFFSRDLNHIKFLKSFPSVEKTGLKFLIFRKIFDFERIKQASRLITA